MTSIPGQDPAVVPDSEAQLALCLALFGEGGDEKPRDPGEMMRLIEEAGTPEDLPYYAREGREIMLRVAAAADTAAEFEQALTTLSEDDHALVESWTVTYYAEICPAVIYGDG